MTTSFLLGFTAFGCLAIAVFFVRFWRASGDRFFVLMAAAFGLLAANRIILGLLDAPNEARAEIYLVRLVAFVTIVVAILDKNRRDVEPG